VFGEGDAQTFNVDLERLLLKYDFDDHLKLSFGRYHTGIGYYNTAFHTGRWLQTTADRPLIMEFAAEGGLLPTQAVGFSVTGLIPSGKLGLNYLVEYGSSDTVRPRIDGSGNEDFNNGNHINLALFAQPDAVHGLQIGSSFYRDRITDPATGSSLRLKQTIVNAHAVYTGRSTEFLNEAFLIRHVQEITGEAHDTSAFYSQLSRRFRGGARPYFRYQFINAGSQSVFSDVSLRHGPSGGIRYDLNEGVAFKLQFDHTNRKGKQPLNGLQSQLAFTF